MGMGTALNTPKISAFENDPMEKCIQNIETCSPGICNTIFWAPWAPGALRAPIFAKSWASQLVGRYWVYKHPPKKWDFDPPKMAIFLLPGTFSGVYSDPLVVLNRIFGAPTPWNTPHSVVFSPAGPIF